MFSTQQNQETWSASCTSPLIFHMRNQSSEGTQATTAGERPLREVEGALASEAEMLWTQASPLTSLSVRAEQGCTNSRGASTDKLPGESSVNGKVGIKRQGSAAEVAPGPRPPQPPPVQNPVHRAAERAVRQPGRPWHAATPTLQSLCYHIPPRACGSPCLLRGAARHRPSSSLKDSDR